MTAAQIGYIGLGAMGGALARRLLATYRLNVWDLNPQAASNFESAGAVVAATASDLAQHCNVILLCLPRSSDVHRLLLGPQGIAEKLAPGTIIIDQTSEIGRAHV